VLTAGPWTAALVPALEKLARPERQVMLWAQPHLPALFQPEAFPVFNLETPEGHFYGFPIFGHPGFKIGKYHHRREAVDPDRMDRECHAEDEAVMRDGIRTYFPDADGPTMAMKTCLFTNSPDEHFIIDRHPTFPQVTLAAGFSGHGFKFCSVVGEILADLALEGATRHDISLFSLTR
jgi:sarcosine oxidase